MSRSPMQQYVLAIDIGTTSLKALVVDRSGRVRASHSVDYPLAAPAPDRAEQNPDQILAAVVQGVRQAMYQAGIRPEELLCASLSAAMHSLIALDHEGRPLTPCIIWADNRSREQAERLKADGRGKKIYLATGTPIHPMSPLPKLMWLREREPELFQRARMFLGIKEYVLHRLFGRYVMDHSLASATGMFNLQARTWDEGALEAAGVEPERLPQLMPTTGVLEGLNPSYAEKMGLPIDLPFVLGASDGVLANLGNGAFEPGCVAVTIGTSGAVRATVREPVTDPHQRLFCYVLTDRHWVIGGAINNGGIMLRWVRDELATLEAEIARSRGLDPYDHLSALASQVPAGSDGLLFLPYLTGERAPYYNANARGVFFGLSLAHGKRHMIRAVMEGVMYRIFTVVKALRELSGQEVEIRASGGFARSAFWCKLMADIIGTRVCIPDTIESSGLGAAKLGLLGIGEIRDFAELNDWNRIPRTYEPAEDNREIYRRLVGIYERVYAHLRPDFDDIADLQLAAFNRPQT
jgi:gluconokinase